MTVHCFKKEFDWTTKMKKGTVFYEQYFSLKSKTTL